MEGGLLSLLMRTDNLILFFCIFLGANNVTTFPSLADYGLKKQFSLNADANVRYKREVDKSCIKEGKKIR